MQGQRQSIVFTHNQHVIPRMLLSLCIQNVFICIQDKNLPTQLPARLETPLSAGEITFISVHASCQTVADVSQVIMFTKEGNICISALDCVVTMNIIITEAFTERHDCSSYKKNICYSLQSKSDIKIQRSSSF